MATMKTGVILLTAPKGDETDFIARKDVEVSVLETRDVQGAGGSETWAHVQVTQGTGDGWVPVETVNLDSVPDPTIKPDDFARQCWWVYMQYGANPYYLTGIAQLRSAISNDRDATGTGPFRLLQAEWDAGRADPNIGLSVYTDRDIADWRKQCIMVAIATQIDAATLAVLLKRQPTWVELCLGQMIGLKAAAIAIANPQDPIDKGFAGLRPQDFPPGGLTASQIIDRYATLLRAEGPPARTLTGTEAMAAITDILKDAFEFAQEPVDSVAQEFVDGSGDGGPTGPPDPKAPVRDKPPAQQDPGPAPKPGGSGGGPPAPGQPGRIDRAFFFAQVRSAFAPRGLTQSQVDGMNAILDEWEKTYAGNDDRWLAYVLGTVQLENGRTFKPVAEIGRGRGQKYGIPDPVTGQTYYGRGFVQLTWKDNYKKFADLLHIDLVNKPDLALDLDVSVQILLIGMTRGLFRSRRNGAPYKLADYFNSANEDWINARNVVNGGLDRASDIAAFARKFLAAIRHV